MADVAESSSAQTKPMDAKPVVVRIKRKASQSPLDAFCELLLLLGRVIPPLYNSASSSNVFHSFTLEELKSKKVFVQHVETVRSTEVTVDIVQLFMEPNSADTSESKTKSEERRNIFKKENIQDQLLSKARQTQEAVAKNARFEQIWRSRKGNKEVRDGKLHEMCHFYDVVRIDGEDKATGVRQQEETLKDHRLLCSYLPLLREFIPSAAEEIESDLQAYKVGEDDYVYDFYTIKDEVDTTTVDASSPFPLVQVDEEEFCDGPGDSDYESDDSNAENNPLNDYPDETSEDEELESETSDNESEEESDSDGSSESAEEEHHGLSEDVSLLYEDDIYA
ncbi:hypothetical protein L484_006899 [Morus notabilis]|uniref:Transcription factor Iwr1 domain-containing protein n=1 Tax=Morus notabilis TaxID=981085 RepID=W9RUV5_9ROSA|nr:hypothetical protein L484_006899 [Morus notabilis]